MPIVTRFPTTFESFGIATDWGAPDNAYADDNLDVSQALSWGINGTQVIANKWKGYGFDALLPFNAIIVSVKATLESEGSAFSGTAQLDFFIFATIALVDLAQHNLWSLNGASPAHSRNVITTDLTADRAWTRADLLDAVFKMHVGATGFDDSGITGGSASAAFDYVSVEVTYTVPLPPYESGRI